jgi:hypothetical protein
MVVKGDHGDILTHADSETNGAYLFFWVLHAHTTDSDSDCDAIVVAHHAQT